VECDWDAVSAGGACPEGLGSTDTVSIGEAAVEERRDWRAERQVLQRGWAGPVVCQKDTSKVQRGRRTRPPD